MIPIKLARSVGVGRTGQCRTVTGVYGQSKKLTLVEIKIFFPDLEDKGGSFLVAISDLEKESRISMDILRPLGISIDAKTGELSIKKEIWEAFKTLAEIGVLTFVGAKILEYLSEEEK